MTTCVCTIYSGHIRHTYVSYFLFKKKTLQNSKVHLMSFQLHIMAIKVKVLL